MGLPAKWEASTILPVASSVRVKLSAGEGLGAWVGSVVGLFVWVGVCERDSGFWLGSMPLMSPTAARTIMGIKM